MLRFRYYQFVWVETLQRMRARLTAPSFCVFLFWFSCMVVDLLLFSRACGVRCFFFFFRLLWEYSQTHWISNRILRKCSQALNCSNLHNLQDLTAATETAEWRNRWLDGMFIYMFSIFFHGRVARLVEY